MQKRNAILVLAGSTVLGTCYIPTQVKGKPSREFIEATYIRPTFGQFIQAEETRRREIMANIRSTRRQIKEQAKEYMKIDEERIERLSVASLSALKETSVNRRTKRKNTLLPGIENIPYSLREEYVAAKEKTLRVIINNFDEIV